MQQIDFYLILEANTKMSFACRLLEKVYKLGHQVYVHAHDAAAVHQFNDMLWIFRDISFIPHDIVNKSPDITAPIQIGFSESPLNHHDIMLNLDEEVPEFYTQFQRIIEIVPQDEPSKEKARNKYRQYKNAGNNIKTHDLRK